MKAKWYFSTLIIILAILGVCQQQTALPNQEIVMDFIDDEVTSDEVQDAIAIVKKELQTLGVGNIQVREEEDGRLKITYYCAINVTRIKKIFTKKHLELGYTFYDQDEEHTKFPSDKKSNGYNIDVYEIQKNTDAESGLDGKYVIELNHDSDRFYNPNGYKSIDEIDIGEIDRIVKIAYKVNKNIAIAIDNRPHNIPEVRAGPVTKGDS